MIKCFPGRSKPNEDVEKYGRWRFVFFRWLGDYLVIFHWVRWKFEDIDSCTGRITWRRPDNVILYSETVDLGF